MNVTQLSYSINEYNSIDLFTYHDRWLIDDDSGELDDNVLLYYFTLDSSTNLATIYSSGLEKITNLTYTSTSVDLDTFVTLGSNYLGDTSFLSADISEIMYFNSVLSSDELNQITTYLTSKWDLSDMVDSDFDGTINSEDAFDNDILLSESSTALDLSSEVDTIISKDSFLSTIESSLELWLDSTRFHGDFTDDNLLNESIVDTKMIEDKNK